MVTNNNSAVAFEQLVSEREMEKLLGLAKGSLAKRRCLKRPHPPFTRIGRNIRYRPSAVVAYLKEHEEAK